MELVEICVLFCGNGWDGKGKNCLINIRFDYVNVNVELPRADDRYTLKLAELFRRTAMACSVPWLVLCSCLFLN